MKSNKEMTTEALRAKRKTLLTLMVLFALLILAYGAYFIYKIATDTWESNSSLGTVGLGVLVVFIANLTIQMSLVNKEINSRNNNKPTE